MHPLADTGRVIAGRYRLEAPVGRGAMGVVWRARDLLLDRDVAVKEVHIAETLTDDERANAYQRTLREAKTAARLNHPGVVTVYDVAEDGGRPWIVMQLVSAQSLDQVLAASGPLSPRRTAEVGRQLLSALSVAHAAGVMHRDVKPSNVLLGRDDRAVLTDFGIATFQGDPRLTQTGMVMGSPGFTAPERIRGEDASPASDLWSLGATLFAAVEGHGPYERRGGAITTMSAIINEDAPPASGAGALGPVIAALLSREPADRPDASAATRMINDALPLLPPRSGPEPAGYQPTALSASSQPPSPRPGPPVPGETSLDFGSAEHMAAADPVGSISAADTQGGGELSPAGTAATTPQPVLGDAARYDQAAYGPTEYRAPDQQDQPATRYDPKGRWGPAGPASGSAAPPPPDFSSWYDPSPRSGAAPSAQPWSGAAYQAAPAGGRRGTSGTLARRPGRAQRAGRARRPRPVRGPITGRPRRASAGRACGSRWCCWPCWAPARAPPPSCCCGTARPARRPGRAAATRRPARQDQREGRSRRPRCRSSMPSTTTRVRSRPDGPRSRTRPRGPRPPASPSPSPTSWSQSTSGAQTYLRDPSANANILIDLTRHTFPNDMVKEAQYIKNQSLAQNRFPGYLDKGLAAETIRGTPGAWWKFTWVDNGVTQEAIDLLFVLQTPAGSQSYALYMTAPASMWSQMRPIFDEEIETFAHLP